jgi:hypothetical protein
MTVQVYRFSLDQFTSEEAKKWLEDNKILFMKFEPASEESISHTGVIGMKWGVRRGPKLPDSSDHATYSAIRKKKVRNMTNDELSVVTKRAALLSLYKRSGAVTKKKSREMSNAELQGHVDKYRLREGLLKSPVRRWNFKDFVKTYKLSEAEAKTLLDRVNAENTYYRTKNANTTAAAKYIKTFLDTNP